MADKRELILARLKEIAGGVPGVANSFRNAKSIDELSLPAICIWDADDLTAEQDTGHGRPNATLVRVTLNPDILIKVAGEPEAVGPELNAIRLALIKAVLTDDTLAEHTSNGGGIRYLGCVTQLGNGRQSVGEMAVAFGLTYVLRPLSD